MRLLSIKIKNFKGIESRKIEPNGESITIYGDNALTKTSILDAIEFMLSERDFQNRSVQSFGIKPRERKDDGSLGEELYGLEPDIETVWELDDGQELTTRKVHREKWVKNRGATQEKLDGYTIDYYWNGKEISYTEFKNRWSDIIEEETAKQLSMPDYVSDQLSVGEKRELLVSLIEYDDQLLIEERPELAEYFDIVGEEDQSVIVDNLKKDRKNINKDLGTRDRQGAIDARIDENQQKITDPEQSREDAETSIETLKENLQSKRDKLSDIQKGGGVAELNIKVQEIEAEKAKYLNEHQKNVDESLKDQREKVSNLEGKVDESQSELKSAIREYEDAKTDVEAAEEAVERIASDIQSESERQLEPKPDRKAKQPCLMGCPPNCPECGANLLDISQEDPEDADNHYEEYLKTFNSEKAEKLKELKADFEQGQIIVDDLYKTLKQKEQAGAQARAKHNQREKALENAKAELERMKSDAPKADTSEFDGQQKALLAKIEELKKSRQTAIDEAKNEITNIESHIEEYQKMIREHDNNAQYRQRIQELTDQKRKRGEELIEVENKLQLIEDFNRAKAETIEGKVNKLFNLVSWRLFEIQNNGGLKEVCDAVYNSNPWQDLSTSEKIKCGIDIIETLRRHYGKSVPVLIDRQESVTQLPESDIQFISTVVSKPDKRLRVETAEKELAVA